MDEATLVLEMVGEYAVPGGVDVSLEATAN